MRKISAPKDIAILRDDSILHLNLGGWPKEAKYIAFKIDDFFLGYHELDNEELQIADIDFDESKNISLAYMDEAGIIGEWAQIDFESLESIAENNSEWRAPKTSANIISENDVITYFLVVLMAALLMFSVEWQMT